MATNPAPYDTVPWAAPDHVATRLPEVKPERDIEWYKQQYEQYRKLYNDTAAEYVRLDEAHQHTISLLANSRMKRRNLKEAYRNLQEAYNQRCRELDNKFIKKILS